MCQAECQESPLSRMGRGLSSWRAQLGKKPDLCLDVQEIKDACGGCLEGGSWRGAAKLVPGETEYRAHSRSSTDDSPSSEDLPVLVEGGGSFLASSSHPQPSQDQLMEPEATRR